MRSKDPKIMKEILEYVENYQRNNSGSSPSKAMISKAVGISRSGASNYLIAMAERNMIRYDGYNIGTRYLENYNSNSSPATQLNNTVSCGYGDNQSQRIVGICELPEMLFGKGDYFIVEASGDSMEDIGVFDKDILIFDKKITPEVGECVVFLDNDGMSALKRFGGFESGEPVLEFMNEKKYPGERYHCNNFVCQGVLKYSIRKY